MGLLISIWIVCFIIIMARQYWSRVVTVSKKVAEIVTSYYKYGLLVTPIVCVPVLLILGLDASVLTCIGAAWCLVLITVSTIVCIGFTDEDWLVSWWFHDN